MNTGDRGTVMEEALRKMKKNVEGMSETPLNSEPSTIEHPDHYGGKDNPYECIKVIEAWELNFTEGNILKYLSRYKKKHGLEDLRKALWYLQRLVNRVEDSNGSR